MRRMITVISLFCALLMLAGVGSASGGFDGSAVVYGRTADKVHLREGPSVGTASKGLYFTGTEVQCHSDPNAEWTSVTIGTQHGYMKSEYLYRGNPNDIQPKQPTAYSIVLITPIYSEPYFEWTSKSILLDGVFMNDNLAVLGETKEGWYYVQAGEVYGYVNKVNVSLSGPKTLPIKQPFANLPMLTYSSGAGGWHTELNIYSDGYFSGYYHDNDMGDNGPEYPNGIRYESYFVGRFGTASKIGNYEYSFNVVYLTTIVKPGTASIVNDVKVIATDPYGFDNAGEMRLYLPGRSISGLSEEFCMWTGIDNNGVGKLPGYGLYNVEGKQGFRSWGRD